MIDLTSVEMGIGAAIGIANIYALLKTRVEQIRHQPTEVIRNLPLACGHMPRLGGTEEVAGVRRAIIVCDACDTSQIVEEC